MRRVWLLLLVFLLLKSNFSFGQYIKLYDFGTDSTDGRWPEQSLISDATYLYGMTGSGGVNQSGTIFKIKVDGTGYTKLLDFSEVISGSTPLGSLISDGTFLYGTTYGGGINYQGTIFKIKKDGSSFLKLLDFPGATNGSLPCCSLLSDGTFLYGVTLYGGSADSGVIFKIKPDGTSQTMLHSFNGSPEGSNPTGALVSDGVYLYGVTAFGGLNGAGTVYRIKPDGTGFTTLLSFGVGKGRFPQSSLYSDSTFLYGMTLYGDTTFFGTIYKIKTDGSNYSRLMDFNGAANGMYPYGSLISDGTYLYGTTRNGGMDDSGTVFKIKPDGSGYVKLYECTNGTYGTILMGSLISDASFLYGMTSEGGVNEKGVIFKYSLAIGINELTSGSLLSPYPNPFTNKLTVQRSTTITLFDYTGKQILRTTSNTEETVLNTEGIAAGFYLLRVDASTGSATDQGRVAYYKVVKQ